MGKLKPIGSEKLTGQDKINRIMEIARYGEVTKNDEYHISTNSFSQKAADGNTYAIIQEKDGYYLKCGINESELDYVSGGMNKKKDRFKSYSKALKRMNLIFKPLNEEYNEGKGHSMYDEMDEQEKFVLNVADEGGDEEMDMDMDMGDEDMGDEEVDMDMDMDMDMGDEDVEVDVDAEVDMEGFMKPIQKLTGKLGQKLRDSGEEMGSADIKYVLNSVISAVDLENLDDEDKDDVLDRFEDDETAYGDDEEMDMDVDMGDEELDMDDEELDMDMEDEEEMAMESLKNRVGSLLESYISKKEKKSIDPKEYLKSRLTNIIKENSLTKKATTIEQEMAIKKIVKKNKNINLKKNNKNGDVILESKNKKIVVKKNGNIK
ncbi:hypothetical protein N8447_00390 [bacterium]|nr:hypothetical protein [bacterium]